MSTSTEPVDYSAPIDPEGTMTEAQIRAAVSRRIGEKQWTNHFPRHTELHDLYDRRVAQDQDIVIIWDDYHQRRGTGKTVGCLQLAAGLDRTDDGLTQDKVCIEPVELRNAYHEQERGSALVMDEAEIGASNRQTQTKINKALREIVATGRVEEKYVILNAPSWNFIDLHLRSMATVWITTLRKGLAQVHFLENDPYQDKRLTPKKGLFEWKDIQTGTRLRDIYNYLTKEKRKHIRGERGESFISTSEHEEELRKVREEVERDVRNETMANIVLHQRFQDSDVRLQDVGEAVGLSQGQVSRILQDFRGDAE